MWALRALVFAGAVSICYWIYELIRSVMQSPRNDGLFVPCKVAGLCWETVSAVLECRFITGSIGAGELAKAKEQFAAMTSESARRLLGLWQVQASNVH